MVTGSVIGGGALLGGLAGGKGGGGGLSGKKLRFALAEQARNNQIAALQSSKLSNPNVFNPFGSRTVEFEGDVPTITESLSDNQQNIFDTREQGDIALGQAGQRRSTDGSTAFDTPFSYEGANDPGDVPQVRTRDDIRDAIIAKSQPFIDTRRRESQDNLLIQGHTRGGRAWNTAQDDLANVEGNIYNNAVISAGQEQQRDFSTREQAYNLGEARRSRDIQEDLFTRNLPLNEARALRGETAQQLPRYQGFAPSQVQPVQALQAIIDREGQRGAAGAAQKQGGASLGGSIISAVPGILSALSATSDRRLKTDIKKIGFFGELPVYVFRYIWDLGRTHIGFMADEVDKVFPGAVIAMPDGYYAVNYTMVLDRMNN